MAFPAFSEVCAAGIFTGLEDFCVAMCVIDEQKSCKGPAPLYQPPVFSVPMWCVCHAENS